MSRTIEKPATFVHWPTALAVAATGLVSIAFLIWVLRGSFVACVRGTTSEDLQKTIAALDGIADVGLKLSTTLTGLGAAVLIGLKKGLKLTPSIRVSLLVSSLLFAQSAFYAVWWRRGIAESWLNDCLDLVTEPILERPYEAHLVFFLLGLFSMGVLVVIASIGKAQSDSAAEEQT
jgi:hypothetical protein